MLGKTGSIGKGVIGGAIDTVKSIGPLEGMTIGATIGTAVPLPFVGTVSGAVAGAAIGTFVGGVNTLGQLFYPNIYDDLKKGAYDLSDNGIETAKEIGKGIEQGVKTIKHVYEDVKNVRKSIGKVLSSVKLPRLNLGGRSEH